MESTNQSPKSIREIAEQIVAGSPVSAGRTKISTEDVIARFPNGIHLTGVDMFKGEKDDYAVFNFREDDTRYYAGGTILTNMVNAFLNQNGGDLTALNEELAATPLGVKLSMAKNKRGQSLTLVEIVD